MESRRYRLLVWFFDLVFRFGLISMRSNDKCSLEANEMKMEWILVDNSEWLVVLQLSLTS